jgi:DMSO/TMAO reductase YedYZ molybdopterin-dependent catalytic subunit
VTTDSDVPTGTARLAGFVAAAVALGVGELVTSLAGGGQSLIGSVGRGFIDRFGGPLKEFAVAVFGTNDKAALIVGIIVVSLLLGTLAGRLAARRFATGAALFAGFAALGIFATANDPQATLSWGVAGAVCAAASGIATLWWLLGVARTGTALGVTTTASRSRVATASAAAAGSTAAGGAVGGDDGAEPYARPAESPTDPWATRRAFFGWSAGASAFAIAAGLGSKQLRGPSKAQQAREGLTLPSAGGIDAAATQAASLDVAGITPWIVPNDDFYRIDTALVTPQVDPATWRLKITGEVDNPYEITFDELLAMPMVEEIVTISCVSNEVGGKLVGNATWQGVPLATLLERAGVRPSGQQIVGRSVDDFTAGFPTEKALDGRTALVAVGMNGEPLPIVHGFPARLVVAGLYGYVSATKWLSEIQLTAWDGVDGYWISRGWAKEAPVKTQSRIDVPKAGNVSAGRTPIAGVAWAPHTGIAKVEVQVDDGPWLEARLGDATNDNAWVQWVAEWDATPGRHRLRVRATDNSGSTQTQDKARPDPDGATGWHERSVTVTA